MRRHSLGVLIARLILGATVLWMVAGCSKTTGGEKWFPISGEVVDAETREPLDSAWAAVGDTLLPQSRWYSETEGEFSVVCFGGRAQVFLYVGRTGYLTVADTLHDVGYSVSGLYYELQRAQ